MVNIKRSTCDASFAYDFVNFVDKFDTAEFKEETSRRKNFIDEYNDENKENETQLNMQHDIFNREKSYLSDFSYLRDQSNLIMKFVDFVVQAGSTPLFKPLNLRISRNQKILIKGSNGIGKSSIIRALFHKMPYTGKIIVKEQDTKTISALELKNEI